MKLLEPRKRYTPEFKTQALELLNTGKPVSQVAEELCSSSNLLYSWRHNSQGAPLGSAGVRAAGVRSEADELRALRRENTRLRQENDILKKAAVILGTRPPSNSAKGSTTSTRAPAMASGKSAPASRCRAAASTTPPCPRPPSPRTAGSAT